jgi:hypothetical protein
MVAKKTRSVVMKSPSCLFPIFKYSRDHGFKEKWRVALSKKTRKKNTKSIFCDRSTESSGNNERISSQFKAIGEVVTSNNRMNS